RTGIPSSIAPSRAALLAATTYHNDARRSAPPHQDAFPPARERPPPRSSLRANTTPRRVSAVLPRALHPAPVAARAARPLRDGGIDTSASRHQAGSRTDCSLLPAQGLTALPSYP